MTMEETNDGHLENQDNHTTDPAPDKLNINSPAVITHCQIVGEIINRLANNSNYCKTICVAVVTVLATFTNNPDYKTLIVWSIPIIVLWVLDSLFVSIKKRLTKDNNSFIEEVEANGTVKPFRIKSPDWRIKTWDTLKSMGDVSTLLFYLAMLAALILHVFWIKP